MQSRESDERFTPRWVFEGMGLTFDLDPCSPGVGGGDAVPTRARYTAAEDGLAHGWFGLVWCKTHAGKRSSMPLMFCSFGAEASAGLRRLAAGGVHRGALLVRADL